MDDNKTSQEKVYANPDSLRELAIYLEGLKNGRGGNLHPLGTRVLDELWAVIEELNFNGKIECYPRNK